MAAKKKPAAKKAPAKKTPAKKTVTWKSTAKKVPAKKAPAKRASKAKHPPKAAPISKVKAKPLEELEGPRPMSLFDFEFCDAFIRTGKQAQAWRQLRPDDKDPGVSAHRMMQRPEIREHIKAIYAQVSKDRGRAVEISARSALLSLEVADDRLMEILESRRKTRGEMLSKDLRTPLVKGITQEQDEDGNPAGCSATAEMMESLEGPAPVEDGDLLKAIDLTYKRKQGIIKAEKPPEVGPVNVLLYKPKWFGQVRQGPPQESGAEDSKIIQGDKA